MQVNILCLEWFVEGMDIVDEISMVQTVPGDRPSEHVVIEKAYIE